MNIQFLRFILFSLVCLLLPLIAAGQVEISAVPSVANPAIGDTVEVAINIAAASNVAGYDFTLIFDPAKLEFIGIENADLLPAGAFVFSPTVGNSSVNFAAAASTRIDKRNGTLALATFRVLTETETTVRFTEFQNWKSTGTNRCNRIHYRSDY